ncbi:hypothetical protein ACX2XH_002147 [Serratia marcescens]|uniref:hypothetical protein n=1 Tax=Serratia TaxID=613 RepID=UPI00066683FC|nr:hypothetical protein [Serratia marcescens]NRN18578.1 hypothetical protein [Serratia marcescens]NRN23903.1 hypothetical protein [Serratia marcescens]NRN53628.1 hypothetical protein [Serratia marcescens]HEJ1087782.1 hypothetical protein [Serratia marcescens]
MRVVTTCSEIENGLAVTQFEYQQLKRLALAIMDKVSTSWPVVFIGVGRSPTPLMAFLECYLGKAYVINLPLSGFRHNYLKENVSLLREPLNDDQNKALLLHFQRFIPIEKVRNSHVVVIDFIDSGASLVAATHYIRHYLRRYDDTDNISAVSLRAVALPECFRSAMQTVELDYADFPIHAETEACSEQHFKLGRGNYYDAISPVKGAFKISEGHLTEMLVENNTAYRDYMRQLAEHMFRDGDIEDPIRGPVQTVMDGMRSVNKNCHSRGDARALHRQYNTFPSHVSCQLKESIVNYSYVTGETLESVVLRKDERAPLLLTQLARTLGQLHWNHELIIKNYERICSERVKENTFHINDITYGYFSQIHGDAHLRNMLVTPEYKLVFIDRMRQCGDILYDFPFILSLLCLELRRRDGYFYSLVSVFFQCYENYVDDKVNFYRAFMVNFINYAKIARETYNNAVPPFKEWKSAQELVEATKDYGDFKTFLISYFGHEKT